MIEGRHLDLKGGNVDGVELELRGTRQECGKGWLEPELGQCTARTGEGGQGVCVYWDKRGAGPEQRLREVQGRGMAE